ADAVNDARAASHAIGAVWIQRGRTAADSDWGRSAMTTAHSRPPGDLHQLAGDHLPRGERSQDDFVPDVANF
ncbi:MAG: hypothetical protein ACOYO9_12285, partial [Candidatus Nanopelagicales bacterium]